MTPLGRCKDCSLGSHHIYTWLLPRTSVYSDVVSPHRQLLSLRLVVCFRVVCQPLLTPSPPIWPTRLEISLWPLVTWLQPVQTPCLHLPHPADVNSSGAHICHLLDKEKGLSPGIGVTEPLRLTIAARRHWLLPSSQITRGPRTSLPMTSLRRQEIRRNGVLWIEWRALETNITILTNLKKLTLYHFIY